MADYLQIKHGTCECRALVYDDVIEVGSISSGEKEKGHGTLVLALLRYISKTSKKPITLHPWAADGDHERLKRWYARNGFWDTGDGWCFNSL